MSSITHNNIFTLTIPSLDLETLRSVVEKFSEQILLFNHFPNINVEWWENIVPISRFQKMRIKIRNLRYDVQLSSIEFSEYAFDFFQAGLDLFAFNDSIPNTLQVYDLNGNISPKVLQKNGWQFKLFIPHPNATAIITSPEEDILKEINSCITNISK